MTFDPATAVQEAAYSALNVPKVTSLGAEVWSHMPEIDPESDPLASTAIVLVNDINLEPIGGKDGGLDLASFEIVCLVRKPDRAELSGLQAAVRDPRGQLDHRHRGDPVAAGPAFVGRVAARGRCDLHGRTALRNDGAAGLAAQPPTESRHGKVSLKARRG
jgi:hypothetical protein